MFENKKMSQQDKFRYVSIRKGFDQTAATIRVVCAMTKIQKLPFMTAFRSAEVTFATESTGVIASPTDDRRQFSKEEWCTGKPLPHLATFDEELLHRLRP